MNAANGVTRRKRMTAVLAVTTLAALTIGGAAPRPAQAPAPAYDPARTFAAEALKADLAVLWDILEEGHAGLDRYAPAATLERSFEAAAAGLTGPLTEFDFYVRLLPLVAAIKDGHTRLGLSAAGALEFDAEQVYFPFVLRFIGERAYVLRDLGDEPAAAPGAELLAIDGRPVVEVLETLLPLVPADAGIRTAKLRRLEAPGEFGRLLALRFGRRPEFRVRFRPSGSAEDRAAAVRAITAADIARLLRDRYPEAMAGKPAYELTYRGPVAVLTVRRFGDDPDKTVPRFPAFLASAFAELAEKGTSGLVIDLRGNGGGMDEYAKFLFAHVMDRPFLYYWALETKKDRYDLFKYTGESAKDADELARPLSRNARGWFDVLGHPNRGIQPTRAPHYAGRVAILIDGGSFSATGETTSAFHYYKKAMFFGEECGAGYYGNTSGFMVTATLPATGLRIRVPLVLYTMAVEGYPKDRGLVPDIAVAPTIEDILAGRDPVMDRALAWLEKK